ncbi:Gfo/Idh/MocA family protein [Litchfieldia salsa]|uniref:Predicted dehydrogenase n=1 Tax=Litchfieldia salsa TaxID=930152 RepID=A0A1H0WP90_9BACI|nr:Gfo/Idh/MocA family oxidoreductase [Litchfieldia salsa]SDP92502.1 Predicted dehydrogenase [Litchfieldia salsa]
MPATKNIKIGVIGLGAIGDRLIGSFVEHPEIEVVAVCDTNVERTESMVQKLEAVKGYTNYKEMLEETKLDLVYIAVPPRYHHQIALEVIEKGIHILCEKPLANSVEEAKDMMEKAQGKGIIQAMNFPLNYSLGANTFKKMVMDGYVGQLRKLELSMHFPQWPRFWQQNDWVASREQGGFVLEVGVHFIQQAQRIFGSITPLQSYLELPADSTKSEVGISAYLELENGVPFVINGLSDIAGDERISFTAYGTEGTLSLVNWSELEGGKLGGPIQTIEATEQSSSLLTNLIKALNGEEAELYDFTAGYEAQVVLEKLRNR